MLHPLLALAILVSFQTTANSWTGTTVTYDPGEVIVEPVEQDWTYIHPVRNHVEILTRERFCLPPYRDDMPSADIMPDDEPLDFASQRVEML